MGMVYKTFLNAHWVECKTEICIGDIVSLTDMGFAYMRFTEAYEMIWGKNATKCAPPIDGIYEYGNKWIIVRIISHYNHPIIGSPLLIGLQDRNFNKLVIGIDGVELYKKKVKDTKKEIKVEKIKNPFTFR